jgi:4-alpha-glucanotransferase
MRRRGVLLPLPAAVSTTSWGVGDCGSVPALAAWLASAGFSDLMLLPLGTMADGQSSPYSACSAMALDPMFLSIDAIDDFHRAGGLAAMPGAAREALDGAKASARVNFSAVRLAKSAALDLAFTSFLDDEWVAHTARAARCAAFIARERWWLDDYALYRAVSQQYGGDWRAWPRPLATRDARALVDARRQFASAVLFEQYLQWLIDEQWQLARRAAASAGVRIYGDVPFAVETASADVWARADEFALDLSAGVPPDAFSASGQDWGLPVYRWDVIAAGGFQWMRARARRAAELFDGVRLDHVVGFYRTYARDKDGHAWFTPPDEATQRWQGEQIISAVREAGLHVLAEDLGVIPAFVRESLTSQQVPGYRVMRWERAYHDPGEPFIDPAVYPSESVAATGTHDTETMADWFDTLASDERLTLTARTGPFDGDVRDALLTRILHAGSAQAFIPMQDVFGWRDRINTPGTVGDHNWTWRLPWPIDTWTNVPDAIERAEFCRRKITAA